MANYLMKYKGTYRVLADLDGITNDFPRDSNTGEIADGYNDLYISCQYGNRIYHYGGSTLVAYIPSLGRGHNILKELDSKGFNYFDLNENDSEVEFKFKSNDIETIATLLKAKTSGANISPMSTKNLPKRKDVEIPTEEIALYKEIVAKVDKSDLLMLSKITNKFLDNILQKKLRKINKDKAFSYKYDIKKEKLARQVKEYIYLKGMWKEYVGYMNTEIDKLYSK